MKLASGRTRMTRQAERNCIIVYVKLRFPLELFQCTGWSLAKSLCGRLFIYSSEEQQQRQTQQLETESCIDEMRA